MHACMPYQGVVICPVSTAGIRQEVVQKKRQLSVIVNDVRSWSVGTRNYERQAFSWSAPAHLELPQGLHIGGVREEH